MLIILPLLWGYETKPRFWSVSASSAPVVCAVFLEQKWVHIPSCTAKWEMCIWNKNNACYDRLPVTGCGLCVGSLL